MPLEQLEEFRIQVEVLDGQRALVTLVKVSVYQVEEDLKKSKVILDCQFYHVLDRTAVHDPDVQIFTHQAANQDFIVLTFLFDEDVSDFFVGAQAGLE
jgi:hypothetical protein